MDQSELYRINQEVKDKVAEELEQYRSTVCKRTPEEVYDDYYAIMAYESYAAVLYNEYLYMDIMENDDYDENILIDVLKWLNSLDNILDTLYEGFMKSNESLTDNWDIIVASLIDQYERATRQEVEE